MTIEFMKWLVGLHLVGAILFLAGLQIGGYWRWQNAVASLGWPRFFAILISITAPFAIFYGLN